MAINKITLQNLVKHLKEPWVPIILGKVEDHEVKLLEYKGEYSWHKHKTHDEFMLVYQGRISIEIKGGEEITFNKGEGAFIEKGTVHRSKSKGKSLVLVFEREGILSDFVKV